MGCRAVAAAEVVVAAVEAVEAVVAEGEGVVVVAVEEALLHLPAGELRSPEPARVR